MTRLTIRIDRIVADRPGLDRAALEQALAAEFGRRIAAEGAAACGAGGLRSQVGVTLSAGREPLPARIASAVAKAVKP